MAAKAEVPDWQRWGGPDPVAEATGITFRREPAGDITAPPGRIRVCAYHIDFDEAPTIYVDVETVAEATRICEGLHEQRGGWNVDFAVAYDEGGKRVAGGAPW